MDGVEVSPAAREALLRIVGEAVSNAARHGQAGRIGLELTDSPHLLVRVSDDGVGFDPGAVDGLGGRHGIVGMRDRAGEIGARLHVASRPGAGTEIRVTLP